MKPCSLPWVNFSTNTFGRARICGYSSRKSNKKLLDTSIQDEWNNDIFRETRLDFLNGKWPENCSRCEHVERLGGISKRMEEEWRFDQMLVDQTRSDGSVPYMPLHMDIRLGNICNLKCIHCGTGASSRWLEDNDILGKYENTESIVLDNKWIGPQSELWKSLWEMRHQTQRYNWLGGEPFASKAHNRFIERLANEGLSKNIDLSYVTNGVLLTDEILEILRKFRSVILRISLDMVGEAVEYFRFPVSWDELHYRLETLKKYDFDLGAQWTASNISMFYLKETYEYCMNNNIRFFPCNFVQNPIQMNPKVLPINIKEFIMNKNENIPGMEFYHRFMMEEDLWNLSGSVLISYLEDLDSIRHTDWRTQLKEFYEAIDGNIL